MAVPSSPWAQPIFDGQPGDAEEVSEVVGDTHCFHRYCLRGDQWIGAPDLLPGLAKESLYQECLLGSIRVECRYTHQLEARLECDAFHPGFSRSGDAGPDFDRCQGGYRQ